MIEKKFNVISINLNKSVFNFSGSEFWDIEKENLKLKNSIKLNETSFKNLKDDLYSVLIGAKLEVFDEKEREVYSLDIEYSGIFLISGYEEDEMKMLIDINCSSYLFPYLRAEFSKIIAETSLPQVNLPPIDFVGLYHAKIKREKEKKS